MGEFHKVATVEEVQPGQPKMAEISGLEVAVYNIDGKFFATSNLCPHQGGPLAEGMMEGDTVICPWHAWVFKVTDGTSPMSPNLKIPCYEVKVDGDDILVNV